MTDRLAAAENRVFGKSLVLFTITGETNGRYYVERFYELPVKWERGSCDWVTKTGPSGRRWINKRQVMFFPKDEEAFVELNSLYENFINDADAEQRQHHDNRKRIEDEFYLSVTRANLLVDKG